MGWRRTKLGELDQAYLDLKEKTTGKTKTRPKNLNSESPVFHLWESLFSFICYLKNISYIYYLVLASWYLEHLL